MEMTTTRTVTTFEMEGGSGGGKMTSSSSVTRSGGGGGGSVTRSGAGAGGEVSMTIIREGQNNSSGSSLEMSKVYNFFCESIIFNVCFRVESLRLKCSKLRKLQEPRLPPSSKRLKMIQEPLRIHQTPGEFP